MFLLDSLMISGIQWTLKTVIAAAEAEMNDDGALQARLLDAAQQHEMGEISDEEYAEIETDLLRAIRDIKDRRDGGSGAIAFGAGEPIEAEAGSTFQVEADVTGDFYGEPAGAPAPAPLAHRPDRVPASSPQASPRQRRAKSSRASRAK